MSALPKLATTEEHMRSGRYCCSCYRRQPRGGMVGCGECGHLWRTGLHLWVHDAWVHLRLWWVDWRADRGRTRAASPWPHPPVRWWHLFRAFRRPARIWVCPCCAHDL